MYWLTANSEGSYLPFTNPMALDGKRPRDYLAYCQARPLCSA